MVPTKGHLGSNRGSRRVQVLPIIGLWGHFGVPKTINKDYLDPLGKLQGGPPVNESSCQEVT